MLSVCVVEDDEETRENLRRYVERYAESVGERASVAVFPDGDDLVRAWRPGVDIILMDIEMRFMDGMEAAHAIRRMDDEVTILFITNAPQYAMKGYEVGAFDYVLKPLDYDVFAQHFDRAVRMLRRRRDAGGGSVAIPVQGGVRRVAADAIRYAEVRDHTLVVHTTAGDVSTRGTMRDLEKELDPAVFFRCHKMYLVNLDYVNGVQGSDVDVDGDRVLVSRARHRPLLDALNRRMGEVGL